MIVGFQRRPSPLPPGIKIGSVDLSCLAWNAFEDLTPLEAARKLSKELRGWLSDLEARPPEGEGPLWAAQRTIFSDAANVHTA